MFVLSGAQSNVLRFYISGHLYDCQQNFEPKIWKHTITGCNAYCYRRSLAFSECSAKNLKDYQIHAARWGAACGTPFDAKAFLEAHPQYEWMTGIIKDRTMQPWTVFKAGDTE